MTAKFVCAAFAAWLVLLNSARAAEQKQNAYPFFPFCIDWHDAKRQSFEQQAEMLKSLGYDGVGHTWLDKVAERLGLQGSDRASMLRHRWRCSRTPRAFDDRLAEVERESEGLKGDRSNHCVYHAPQGWRFVSAGSALAGRQTGSVGLPMQSP